MIRRPPSVPNDAIAGPDLHAANRMALGGPKYSAGRLQSIARIHLPW